MLHKISAILFLSLVLTGCAAPTVATVPTLAPFPTSVSTATSVPTLVVTLSRNTPVPVTRTPTPNVTLPAGAVLVTVSGDGFVNARSGPGALYEIVGRFASGSQMAAIAQSPAGDWILLSSAELEGGQGWVFIHLTDLDPAGISLPIATPAATPANP